MGYNLHRDFWQNEPKVTLQQIEMLGARRELMRGLIEFGA